jgi:hypothetical protein
MLTRSLDVAQDRLFAGSSQVSPRARTPFGEVRLRGAFGDRQTACGGDGVPARGVDGSGQNGAGEGSESWAVRVLQR